MVSSELDFFVPCTQSCICILYYVSRRGSRISARGGRQGNDDLIWDGNERFLTYANTDLQLFEVFIAILCLNGVEQPFKRHQCPFFLPLRRGNPRLRRGSFRPRGGRSPQRPPPGSAPAKNMYVFDAELRSGGRTIFEKQWEGAFFLAF